jgi:hypothetical protein
MLPNQSEYENDLHPVYMAMRKVDSMGSRIFDYSEKDNYLNYLEDGEMQITVNYEIRQKFLSYMVHFEMSAMKADPDLRTPETEANKKYVARQFKSKRVDATDIVWDPQTALVKEESTEIIVKRKRSTCQPVWYLVLWVRRKQIFGLPAQEEYIPVSTLMSRPLTEYRNVQLSLSDIDFGRWQSELMIRLEVKPPGKQQIDLLLTWHKIFAIGNDVAVINWKEDLIDAIDIAYFCNPSDPEPEFEYVQGMESQALLSLPIELMYVGPPPEHCMTMDSMKKIHWLPIYDSETLPKRIA